RVYYIPYAIQGSDVWEMRCPIVCLKTDGTELWRAAETFWGTEASTPLVEGDTLYVGADNPDHVVLVALDKMTGELRWSAAAESDKRRELAAPASLTYQVVGGIPQVIVATYGTREVLGVHAETGRILWRYPYPADIIMGLVSTPVAAGPRLFISGGEGRDRNFSALLRMEAKDGGIAFEEIYRSTDLQTNNFNTVAIVDDAVFGFGGGDNRGFLHATDLGDGRLLWKVEGDDWTKNQQLVVADGLIFAIARKDELVLAAAGREGCEELGRVAAGIELGRPQQPTIANGRLYLRGLDSVVCFGIAE
ncbi:MAG: PQQ-binding-like beta-propeller repeat protein, partial [Planctomycetes bacterium]|nr:PQQ-binding-like beta-propeller repeat protein [Planctomycetota bacterium]